MSEVNEHMEHAEHAALSNKKIALVIAVLALFLSFSETLGKSAQTEAISANVESADLWAFFQAKTVRMTQLTTAAEQIAIAAQRLDDPGARAAVAQQIDTWKKTAARYDSDPETREGRQQLAERAKDAEKNRDVFLAKYHHYELASAAFQIGIVLASAAVITGMIALAYFAGALGLIGLSLLALGLLAPHAVPLLAAL
ncbi:MAG TPA: DUF4337 domain-containing protein [Xanthobacteraceae bacterium]|jgi:hypothetical protein